LDLRFLIDDFVGILGLVGIEEIEGIEVIDGIEEIEGIEGLEDCLQEYEVSKFQNQAKSSTSNIQHPKSNI